MTHNKLLNETTAAEGMADPTFSEAWKPAPVEQVDSVTASEVKSDAAGGTVVTAMTAGALEAKRTMEAQVAKARTEEERKMAREAAAFYRVHLTFAGREAEIVRSVLGDTPAQKLLLLCTSSLPTNTTNTTP